MNWLRKLSGNTRRIILFLFDILCFLFIDIFYYFICVRAANSIPVYENFSVYMYNSLILLILISAFRFGLGVYNNVWRYTSTRAYFRLILADCFAGLCSLLLSRILDIYIGIWQFVTVASLSALLALVARMAYRLIYKKHNASAGAERNRKNIAIVGAGQLGVFLANDLRSNPNSAYTPMCFIDRDKSKIGSTISGLDVFDEKDVTHIIDKYNIHEVIIAIARIDSEDVSQLYFKYCRLGCKVKIYDSLVYADGGDKKRVIREFEIDDLLFRQPVDITNQAAYDFYTEKTVLVTGGGGSIGSELCRQIAKCRPKKLIILDIYENNAYDIQQELIMNYGSRLDLSVEIASVRDRARLEGIFKRFRPDIVFHAAAHKHVPLMEHSGCEAIKNNVIGTYNTADMAEKYGVGKFILISTDKAVNPTNIMGASKRLCEMVIQCRNDSKTCFAAVRFGNVLGSNGSVIPLFKRQIAAGGPVTITDKRIIRYFMTIPEASQLVIQAGAMAKKGELFVLDMGKPVRIYDLAVNMIQLSGFEPDVDIKIEEIGLRPGEKLYEELLMKTEELDKTDNDLIFVERDACLTREEVEEKLAVLRQAVEKSCGETDSDAVRDAIARVVPTFHDPREVNRKAEKSSEMKMMSENNNDSR